MCENGRVANASVRLPSGEVVELDDEQQARLDAWVVEARSGDLDWERGAGGVLRQDGEADRRFAPAEAGFDEGSAPCWICGLRVGEGRMAWERSVTEARPHGSNRWYSRHKTAMRRGDEDAEPCEASRAADRAYTAAAHGV